jgi:hypothetical protein
MTSDHLYYNHAMTSATFSVGQGTENATMKLAKLDDCFSLNSAGDAELTEACNIFAIRI